MQLPEGVEIRELPPPDSRRRVHLSVYEVRRHGKVVGRVETKHIGGARHIFYFAFGIHPSTGREVRLEGNTDFEERIATACRFTDAPDDYSQHTGGYSGGRA